VTVDALPPDVALVLENVSKKYRLFPSRGHRLREALHPFRRSYHREFWALRDVTLRLSRSQTVGILGLNGSGKSTLLQIIASVLQPTSGTVRVNGKVAALLELGAGFNPDLTGRENVVLNGTIQGLEHHEILARMEAIQTFADIGEFFDQPVRTYSSGMFMRVAFSTALYVDPDVLIIDEALAVGDAKFQEKCFRRFRTFQEAGKTILFVTHDRSALPRHCDLGILLHQGHVVEVGEPARIADLYGEILAFGELRRDPPDSAPAGPIEDRATDSSPGATVALRAFMGDRSDEDRCAANPTYNRYEYRFGNGHAAVIDYAVVHGHAVNPPTVPAGARVDLYFKVLYRQDMLAPIVGMIVKSKEGVIAYGVNTEWMKRALGPARTGEVAHYRFTVPLGLCAGDWFIDLAVAESSIDMCDNRSALIHLTLVEQERQFWGLARLDGEFAQVDPGDFAP